MKRRASKLRSFVPKPVDRKVEGSEENETEDKLPELVSSSNKLWFWFADHVNQLKRPEIYHFF